MEAVTEADNVTLAFMNRFGNLNLKCSHQNTKGGFLSHVLGFEVTERIQEMEAITEADNVALAFMNQFGRFKLQNAHIKI